MKVLSVRQPWAWALIYGGKDIENRSWKTQYRGPVAIHASKGMTKQEYFEFVDAVELMQIMYDFTSISIPNFTDLVRGQIIGVVDLVDVVEISDSPWFFGDFGWVMQNPCPVAPTNYKGMLGLRDYRGARLNLSSRIQT